MPDYRRTKESDAFSNPYRLSFKDYLAIAFSVSYLVMILLRNFIGLGDIENISLLNNPMAIILTGYFVHEISRMVTDKGITTQISKGKPITHQPPKETSYDYRNQHHHTDY